MARYLGTKEGFVLVDKGSCRGPIDIYFKEPYWDEHIASEEHPGPKFISSRGEKKAWLERCHLREAGDRHHGASSFDRISHRHAMESLRKR
jgi:hypothetical protein